MVHNSRDSFFWVPVPPSSQWVGLRRQSHPKDLLHCDLDSGHPVFHPRPDPSCPGYRPPVRPIGGNLVRISGSGSVSQPSSHTPSTDLNSDPYRTARRTSSVRTRLPSPHGRSHSRPDTTVVRTDVTPNPSASDPPSPFTGVPGTPVSPTTVKDTRVSPRGRCGPTSGGAARGRSVGRPTS